MRLMLSLFAAAFAALWYATPAQAQGSPALCKGAGFSDSCCAQAGAKGLFAGGDSMSKVNRWDFLNKCKAREEQKGKK